MTVVPLPASPCVRARLVWNEGTTGEGGFRIYLSYSGSAPSGANCTTLATDIATQWATNIAPITTTDKTLNEVDVLDIATRSGLSGVASVTHAGTRSGTALPNQCATNVEFGIARRYRGGKPRAFLVAGAEADLLNQSTYQTSYVSAVNTAFANFISGIEALSIGSMGTLAHVSLSYYYMFTNIPNSSGRVRAVPTYKDVATLDTVTGYFCKATIGSQKRRRTSTTP